MPLPQILKTTMVASAIKASSQFVGGIAGSRYRQTQTDTDDNPGLLQQGEEKRITFFYTD